ncbi:MAG TPA: ATP synthase subunit I [Smithella sp.]|nr:ATP synthase subunit I [Smithella sp.]
MNLIVKDPLQRKIEFSNWIILAVILVPSLIFAPVKFSLGILLGGFISILNFYWMEKGLHGLFNKTGGNINKGPVLVKYYIRLAITAVILYFLIAYKTVDVIGLLIGLSVVVINMIIMVISSLTKKNLIKEVI